MGTFTCAACGCGQKKGAPFKVNAANLPAVLILFLAAGRAGAEELVDGSLLCTERREWKGRNGQLKEPILVTACCSKSDAEALGKLFVGQPVSRLFCDERGRAALLDGTILRITSNAPTYNGSLLVDESSITYEAVFESDSGAPKSVILSQDEAREANRLHDAVQDRLTRALRKAGKNTRERGSRAAAAAAAAAEADSDEEDCEQIARGLRWPEVLDESWWDTWGHKISPTLHRSLFGFSTPRSMRHFFNVFFEDEAADETYVIGLTQYELYTLGLMRARTGWQVQHLAALTGANRGRLGSETAKWIHKLGAVGRSFIGVPEMEYLMESMPAQFKECGMGNTAAIGDASDFLTETPRVPFMKKVRNMMYSDKMKHSAARGTSFCSANGMTIIILGLVFGRCSELACVLACRSQLAKLPHWVSVAYDKGIRGMRSILPNFNFVFMPCFLAPSKGKDKFEVDEAVKNRGIARNRYVVEITYKRGKEWHLLKEIVGNEDFHLMNSTWFWAMGFANLQYKFLQPPPDAETARQKVRREARVTSDKFAASTQPAVLREAAARAAAAAVDAAMEVEA
jgi:hypothetical protein